MKIDRRRLVVDACIARSAGGWGAIAEVSQECRNFLFAMFSNGLRLVMTRPIKAEWDVHKSKWCSRWRGNMGRRGLVCFIQNSENPTLWDKIKRSKQNPRNISAMEKDFRYIEAAVATDNSVVSTDKEARSAFSKTAKKVNDLKNIVWVDPCLKSDKVYQWISQNAPEDDWRKLGK
ncbi:MAG: hypothetical protein ACFFAY_15555 [Promethearchaeota archaeon]